MVFERLRQAINRSAKVTRRRRHSVISVLNELTNLVAEGVQATRELLEDTGQACVYGIEPAGCLCNSVGQGRDVVLQSILGQCRRGYCICGAAQALQCCGDFSRYVGEAV
jgi:hypothetical protein